jgi:hypothetical protein
MSHSQRLEFSSKLMSETHILQNIPVTHKVRYTRKFHFWVTILSETSIKYCDIIHATLCKRSQYIPRQERCWNIILINNRHN